MSDWAIKDSTLQDNNSNLYPTTAGLAQKSTQKVSDLNTAYNRKINVVPDTPDASLQNAFRQRQDGVLIGEGNKVDTRGIINNTTDLESYLSYVAANKQVTNPGKDATESVYMFNANDGKSNKFGTSLGYDTAGNLIPAKARYTPGLVNGYGWKPGPKGINPEENYMQLPMKARDAIITEGAIHDFLTRQGDRTNLREPNNQYYSKQITKDYGPGKGEYYLKDKIFAGADQSKVSNERGKEIYDALTSRTYKGLAATIQEKQLYYDTARARNALLQSTSMASNDASREANTTPLEATVGAAASGFVSIASSIERTPQILYDAVGNDALKKGSNFQKNNPKAAKVFNYTLDVLNRAADLTDKFSNTYLYDKNDKVYADKLEKEISDGFEKGKYVSTFATSIIHNPAGAVALGAQSLAISIGLTERMGAKAPVFASLTAQTYQQTVDEFKKEHNGQNPSGSQKAIIALGATFSTALEMETAEKVVGKTGLNQLSKASSKIMEWVGKSIGGKTGKMIGSVFARQIENASVEGGQNVAQQAIQHMTANLDQNNNINMSKAFNRKNIKDMYVQGVEGAVSTPGIMVSHTGLNIGKLSAKKTLDIIQSIRKGRQNSNAVNSPDTAISNVDNIENVSKSLTGIKDLLNNKTINKHINNIDNGRTSTLSKQDRASSYKQIDDAINTLGESYFNTPKDAIAPSGENARKRLHEKILSLTAMKDKYFNQSGSTLNNRPIKDINRDISNIESQISKIDTKPIQSSSDEAKTNSDIKNQLNYKLKVLNLEKQLSSEYKGISDKKDTFSNSNNIQEKDSVALKLYGGVVGGEYKMGILDYARELLKPGIDDTTKEVLTEKLNRFIDSQKRKLDSIEAARREWLDNYGVEHKDGSIGIRDDYTGPDPKVEFDTVDANGNHSTMNFHTNSNKLYQNIKKEFNTISNAKKYILQTGSDNIESEMNKNIKTNSDTTATDTIKENNNVVEPVIGGEPTNDISAVDNSIKHGAITDNQLKQLAKDTIKYANNKNSLSSQQIKDNGIILSNLSGTDQFKIYEKILKQAKNNAINNKVNSKKHIKNIMFTKTKKIPVIVKKIFGKDIELTGEEITNRLIKRTKNKRIKEQLLSLIPKQIYTLNEFNKKRKTLSGAAKARHEFKNSEEAMRSEDIASSNSPTGSMNAYNAETEYKKSTNADKLEIDRAASIDEVIKKNQKEYDTLIDADKKKVIDADNADQAINIIKTNSNVNNAKINNTKINAEGKQDEASNETKTSSIKETKTTESKPTENEQIINKVFQQMNEYPSLKKDILKMFTNNEGKFTDSYKKYINNILGKENTIENLDDLTKDC